jgi:hypothetical protein
MIMRPSLSAAIIPAGRIFELSSRQADMGDIMKAIKLIAGTNLDPAALKSVGHAFDDAWADIAANYQGKQSIEAARLKLANIVLTVAKTHGHHDVSTLKSTALQVFNLATLGKGGI